MKCPNCNKEVSPEFNVCPWCGYKPKKCSKPEHQDVWLPVEARFCPRCGSPLLDVKGATELNESQTRGHCDSLNENLDFSVGGVSFKMIRVEGGSFLMGATAEQGSDTCVGEKPVHRVTLDDYYIGETVVTQALWEAVMGGNPSVFKGDDLPVEYVAWKGAKEEYDIQTFLRKLNEKVKTQLPQGKQFTLPTEAQWEFAARGGIKRNGYKYSGSNDLDEVAWYYGNSGNRTHPVKGKNGKKPNELGIYGMSGNVWEWCHDWCGSYSSSAQVNPTGPSSGSARVCRGGSWRDSAECCCVAWRGCRYPDTRFHDTGFRLVLQ